MPRRHGAAPRGASSQPATMFDYSQGKALPAASLRLDQSDRPGLELLP